MEQIRDALGHSTVKITEQHYAQIHPDYREKTREHARRTYASDVTYKVWRNKTHLLFFIYIYIYLFNWLPLRQFLITHLNQVLTWQPVCFTQVVPEIFIAPFHYSFNRGC